MVQNYPAKKKLQVSKVAEIVILLGIPVHVDIVRINIHEGVWMKAREGLQCNRNTKICRIAYCKVPPDLNITATSVKYR